MLKHWLLTLYEEDLNIFSTFEFIIKIDETEREIPHFDFGLSVTSLWSMALPLEKLLQL